MTRRRPGWWRQLTGSLVWDLLRVQKWWVRLMFAAIASSIFATMAMSLLIKGFVDNGLVEQTVPLQSYLGAGAALAVLVVVLNFAGRQLIERVSYQLEYDLRSRLYRTFQTAEGRELDRMANGQLVTRSMTDVATVEQAMNIVPFVLASLPGVLGFSVVVLALSPLMGLLTIASLPINVWLLNRFRRPMRSLSWLDLNERAEVASAIDEPVRGIRVVKAFGQEAREQTRVAGVALRAYRFAMSRVRLLARYDIPMKIVPVLTQTIVLIVGATLVADGGLSLGTFLLVFQAAVLITGAASFFGDLASIWQYLASAQTRLADVINMASRESRGRDLPPHAGGLQLEDVTVTLGGRVVLSGLDVAADSGELVVVHGAPGAGKSTLAAVIAGVVPADSGFVSLDGVDPRDIDVEHVHRAVRVVSEEPFVFATTVRENLQLALGHDAPDDVLRRALWAAAADTFVEDLPGGVDAHVGDRGLTLSGGQRQRLALARALVEPPRVLVLDDALSAVNPSMEVEILRRIREVAPQAAIVCISRRTGAATVADAVVTLPDPVVHDVQPDDGAVGPAAPAHDLTAAPAGLVPVVVSEEHPRVEESSTVGDRPVAVRTLLVTLRRPLALALIAVCVTSFGALAGGILFGNLADLLREGRTGDAILRAVAVFGIGLVSAFATYVFRVRAQQFIQGGLYLLRRRIFHRLSRLGVDYYDRELPGEVATRVVNDLDRVARFAESRMFLAVTEVVLFVLGSTLIAVISPPTAVVVLAIGLAILAMTVVQFPLADRALARARDRLGSVVTAFEEDFTARQDVRGLGARARRSSRFLALSWKLRAARRRATVINTFFAVMFEFIGNVGALFVLWRAGGYVLAGSVTVGAALTLSLLTRTATGQLYYVGTAYAEFLTARVSWRRLAQPYDVPVLPVDTGAGRDLPRVTEGICFEDVRFTYPGTQRQVLKGVTFDMPAGSVIGLVGYTGAGKSSIAKLLTRTYDVDAGAILVDGTDIRDIDLRAYRARIGVVPQDAFLFRGTVASNIGYGSEDVSREVVEAAAIAVGGYEVLAALPGGFDHVVEEEARNLTAAQRQLIALARAWLIRPEVMILDEATSCLDANLESRVLQALGDLDCTTLMITHREHVAASCDYVVVLDEGIVAEAGQPDELIGADGPYDRLWVAVPELVTVAP